MAALLGVAAFHAVGFAASFEGTGGSPTPQAPAEFLAVNAGGKTPKSLAYVVYRVERRAGGEFIVTFEDGQVWQQMEPDAKIELERGESVVIRRRAGSFVLESRTGLSTKVKRIR